jgi:3-keto-disaccharide hydrolase
MAALVTAPQVDAQGSEVSLFDGKSLEGWEQLGSANWRVEDGAIVADNKVAKPQNYIVSKQSFKNFVLHVEFWASNVPTAECTSAAAIRKR